MSSEWMWMKYQCSIRMFLLYLKTNLNYNTDDDWFVIPQSCPDTKTNSSRVD